MIDLLRPPIIEAAESVIKHPPNADTSVSCTFACVRSCFWGVCTLQWGVCARVKVMNHFIHLWLFRFCFVGGCLLCAAHAAGQGMRDLLDLTPSSTAPPPSYPLLPGPAGYTLSPSLPSTPPNIITVPQPLGSPEGEPSSPSTFPPMISKDLGRVLMGLSASSPSNVSSPAPSSGPSASGAAKDSKQLLEINASIFEENTEDDREEQELQAQRQRAEQIVDPERRQKELEQVQRSESNRQNRLTRRAADEIGAELFYVPRLKEQFLKEGWCQLFDGYTDTGWKIQTSGYYGGGNFTFGNNEICSDPYKPGMIYTTMPFGDVSLRLDFCAEKDARAFLLVKTPPNPEDLNSSCYAFVLNSDQSDRPRGILLGRHGLKFAELRTMRSTQDNLAKEEAWTWHTVLVKCEGNDSQCWIDGRRQTYFDPNAIPSGHIALLVTKGKVRFQNILWQPSPVVSIFDTENREELPWRLSNGAELAGSDAVGFQLTNGSVESKEVFDHFVLQMQYRQGMNAGQASLFIRPLSNWVNTGYEISLQNCPKRKDREATVGVDAGSFRQIRDARCVRAQDQQWTYLTAAVVNRQLQTWVNGVPVCEITDRRKERENSLIGPFLKPGPVRLSVPPDNTFFEFRHLTVSSILLP